MATTTTSTEEAPRRERRPSTSAPLSELQGPVGPGFSRPKHKRTFTGFGAGEIKNVEGKSTPLPIPIVELHARKALIIGWLWHHAYSAPV
jgi:hypothetical protein